MNPASKVSRHELVQVMNLNVTRRRAEDAAKVREFTQTQIESYYVRAGEIAMGQYAEKIEARRALYMMIF